MMKQLSVWNVGTAVFGAIIAWMLVKQFLPASVSIGGNMLLLIGLLSAGGIVLTGEILIKKQALTGTAEKTARLVAIILGLIIATATVVNVWTWGTNIFTLPTLAAIVLIGIILNGLYWEMRTGTGTISRTVFRMAVTLLIFGALMMWLIGEQLMDQSGKALQVGARSQLSAWLNGQQPSSGFEIGWSNLALGFLVLFFVFGLMKYEIIKKTNGLAATILILPLIIWFAWGALPTEFKEGVGDVALSITPNFIQITPAQREAARLREAEERAIEAEAEKQRIINAAVAQAAAEAEAAKYRPLTTDAFTTKTIGTFEPIVIKSGQRVGPITRYNGTCLYWTKTGMGMITIYSRPDFVSKPTMATLTDREYGIKKWGHKDVAFQMFFEAKRGDIQIELERREGNDSC